MQFTDADRNTLSAVMRWRRDVRHFRRDPVPGAVLDRLRGAMDLSPSVGNARPWRVMRVQTAALRAGVIEEFTRCNNEAAAGYDDATRAEYLRLKLAGLIEAPEHLAVFTDLNPAAGRGLGRQTMPETLAYSTVMAIHTLWLAARAENIGLGWVSILDPVRMAAILNVPEGWRFTAYLCLGYAARGDDTPLLHRVGWQENAATRWDEV
ncbi:MAG: 5,6-dimethylbenzimidazole synthase [Paracoccus sp. (in: a-proteobacteria)]|uniref:5,6-dimethylbenzimidazole synthase n=1 Tax=Paracoccus sp. TaxID=267 RepID=UPI0026DF1DD9|nr:5,6-dimethylbenzimidazole synthase [Paracoccus sp. (in: a-proteobacteria)]MDO5631828.1 5,6-dimethylbenzimidazole synthase [Paracoccus sp. (in: a-proteobacteria)]